MADETAESRTVADEFEVRLAATPTTGFKWQLGDVPQGVELLDTRFDQGVGAAPGDSGQQVFRFRVAQAGNFVLPFELKQPWSTEVVRTHRLHIRRPPS
jgi:inhibitor of cysteine peptidase